MEELKHSITLTSGYTDKKGKVHKEVEFGYRLTMKDMFVIDADPKAKNPTQYQDMIRAKTITKFGELKLPLALNVLLDLDGIDRQDVAEAADTFVAIGNEGKVFEHLENNTVKVGRGFIVGGAAYNIIQFGNVPTGRDEVQADTLGLSAAGRQAFLVGKHILRISTEDGTGSIEGPVDLITIETMDAYDWNMVIAGCEFFRLYHRAERATVPGQREGGGDISTDAIHGNEGTGNSGASEAAD